MNGVKVGTHEGTLVPATSLPEEFTRRDRSQGLVPRTVHSKRFEKLVAGICAKNSNWFEFVGLVARTKDFEAKMACSHYGICPRDLLQGLVAAPRVCRPLSGKRACLMISTRELELQV